MQNSSRRDFSWVIRLVLVILGLAAWRYTQYLISLRPMPTDPAIGDRVIQWLSPWHDYLAAHRQAADAVLISSSAVIDGLGLFLLLRSIFGPTIRPFLGLLILFCASANLPGNHRVASASGNHLVRAAVSIAVGYLWHGERFFLLRPYRAGGAGGR